MSKEEIKKFEDLGKILSGETVGSSDVNFEQLDRIWESAGSFQYAESKGNDAGWNAIQAKLSHSNTTSSPVKVSWIKRYSWAAAAAFALLLVGGAGAWLANTKDHIDLVAQSTVKTGVNEYKTIDLSDGSQIKLNSNSTLVVAAGFNQINRSIELTGQADFEVAKNAAFPFVVKAGLTTTKVLGTGFDIQAYPGENVKIFLKHGAVSFGTKSETLKLQRDESAVYFAHSGDVQNLNGENFVYWQGGEWVFKKTPIHEIADMFKHRFGKTLKYDAADADRQFTGKFKSDATAEEIVAILEEALQLKLIIE